MRNKDSLTHLRLKIMGGYVSLIALFVIASVIVVFKSGGLEENSERYRENIERRSLSEGAFLQLFDLTQLGGQAAIWDSTRIAAYEKKEKSIMMTLDSMIMTIPDTAQVRRVREIKQLVSEKKGYLLAIHQDLEQLRDVSGLMQQKMPQIIRQANRANQQLTDEVSENLKENRHKTTGMFGWLKSKKKANAKTEAENQQALNRARQQTDRILTSLATDIQQSQERSANQLFQHMEDLVRKESLINEKITQLAQEFNMEDSQMRKLGSTHLMSHQRETLHLVMWFGFAAFVYESQTVNVIQGDYGLVLDVPSTITANGKTWKVIGIEKGALDNNTALAAIIWEPAFAFNGTVSNPNLLLYVKDKSYAPADIKNVIVNGEADAITLTDAESGNNFYCPQAFTAKSVHYEHHYGMTSGLNVCQGWETIVLPFDVSTVTRESGETLVPYASWSVGSSQRPFWLYSLESEGWKEATALKANTPYIICMPNNEYYDAAYNIKGNVVFAATHVEIKASDNIPNSKSGDRTFVPNYLNQEAAQSIYALNVNNLWSKNTETSLAEGSTFVSGLRPVRPFEAYMTTGGNESASRYIYIFGDDYTTDMLRLPSQNKSLDGVVRVYSLSGTLIKQSEDKHVLEGLPKGVYIINGRKVIVK